MNAQALHAREQARNKSTGEFGTQSHSDPLGEIPLASPLADVAFEHSDDRIDIWDDRAVQGLSERQMSEVLMRRASAIANRIARRHGFDPSRADDMKQQALVELMGRLHKESIKRGDDAGKTTPEKLRSILANGGLLEQCFRSVAQWERFDPKVYRAEDVNAFRQLQESERAFEDEHRRTMTQKERDERADEIRMSWPAGRRPHLGYQNFSANTSSLDSPVASDPGGDLYLGDVIEDGTDYSTAGRIGDDGGNEVLRKITQREHDAHEKGAKLSSFNREKYGLTPKNAWSAFAQVAELPKANNSLSRSKADRAKQVVLGYEGGAASLAKDWRNGDVDEDTAAHLFAPFGDLPPKGEDEVAVAIMSYPHVADQLWGSALSESVAHTRKRA